ncbi:hypothetical protein QUF51_07890 [Bacillus pumilus]|nr:hypothetical protein [Bacillus pumilus]
MKSIYKFDENSIYVIGGDSKIPEDEEIPKGFTDKQPQEGLYKAKYDPESKTWSESATQDYIDSLQMETTPDSLELLKLQNSMLSKEIVKITKDVEDAKQREAQLAKQLALLMTEIQSLKAGDIE